MANPTDVEGFSFALAYDYLDWQTGEWNSTQFKLGEGQAGLDAALAGYEQVDASGATSGENAVVRNLRVEYASIVVWTAWEVSDTAEG